MFERGERSKSFLFDWTPFEKRLDVQEYKQEVVSM